MTVLILLSQSVLTKTGQWPGNAMGCYIVSLSYLVIGPGSVCCLGFWGPFLGEKTAFPFLFLGSSFVAFIPSLSLQLIVVFLAIQLKISRVLAGISMLEAGFGFTAPSYNTIVSWRVSQEDQV
jgi:hypothetical protein